MKIFLYTFPVALLVAYSQLIVKWRAQLQDVNKPQQDLLERFLGYFSDWYILSGYVVALLSSFIWLLIIPRIPLSIGFPMYIGITFILVLLGSRLFLDETLSMQRIVAATLILIGIILGGIDK